MVAPLTFPTVREMGRLALPLGTTLAGGELGLDRTVRWARTSGVLSPLFPELNADEVALLDLPLVQASNPALMAARVVRELSRLRIAALVLKGEIDTPTIREAERSNTPLFLLPSSAELPRVGRAIIRLITDREAQEETQASHLYRLLSQQIVGENGLTDVIESLHTFTRHAITLTDTNGELLASAGVALTPASTRSVPVEVAGVTVATLTMSDGPELFDPFTAMALEQGAAALALELAKLEAVTAARSGTQLSFLEALVRGAADDLIRARARAADYALDGYQWVVLTVADSLQTEPEATQAWLKRTTRHAEEVGYAVRTMLTLPSPAQPGLADSPTLVMVLGGGAAWDTTRSAFLAALHSFWFGGTPLSLAVGDTALGLDGLQQSLVQAQDALALGLRLFGAGRDYLHREMGVYRLLRHLQGTEDLREFVAQTLGALARYDQEHHAALLPTLETFLAHGGNVSAAAAALHLHRNSLLYRLERIRTIAALDPADPEDSFLLKLALLITPLQ